MLRALNNWNILGWILRIQFFGKVFHYWFKESNMIDAKLPKESTKIFDLTT